MANVIENIAANIDIISSRVRPLVPDSVTHPEYCSDGFESQRCHQRNLKQNKIWFKAYLARYHRTEDLI